MDTSRGLSNWPWLPGNLETILTVQDLFLRAKRKFQGQVFVWFLILHSTGRLLIERFRGDERGVIPGTDMTGTQLVALLILLAALGLLFIRKSREKKVPRP